MAADNEQILWMGPQFTPPQRSVMRQPETRTDFFSWISAGLPVVRAPRAQPQRQAAGCAKREEEPAAVGYPPVRQNQQINTPSTRSGRPSSGRETLALTLSAPHQETHAETTADPKWEEEPSRSHNRAPLFSNAMRTKAGQLFDELEATKAKNRRLEEQIQALRARFHETLQPGENAGVSGLQGISCKSDAPMKENITPAGQDGGDSTISRSVQNAMDLCVAEAMRGAERTEVDMANLTVSQAPAEQPAESRGTIVDTSSRDFMQKSQIEAKLENGDGQKSPQMHPALLKNACEEEDEARCFQRMNDANDVRSESSVQDEAEGEEEVLEEEVVEESKEDLLSEEDLLFWRLSPSKIRKPRLCLGARMPFVPPSSSLSLSPLFPLK